MEKETGKIRVNKNKSIPVPRTMWSNPYGFLSPAGNGRKIPQFELDKQGNAVPKLDEHGKPVFKNLTAEIQLFKGVNDYKKFIAMNGDDLSSLEPAKAEEFIDTTKFGTAQEVLNAVAKIRNSGKSLGQWINEFNAYVNSIRGKKQVKQEPKKEELPPKQQEPEKGNENEKK